MQELDPFENHSRTHYCCEVSEQDLDKEVTLVGWVHRRRDHGGVIFVDLRDRSGRVQAVFNPQVSFESHQKADTLRSEFVIGVKGVVRRRPEGMENPKMKTDLEFARFLRHEWMKTEVLPGLELDKTPKPVNMPVAEIAAEDQATLDAAFTESRKVERVTFFIPPLSPTLAISISPRSFNFPLAHLKAAFPPHASYISLPHPSE